MSFTRSNRPLSQLGGVYKALLLAHQKSDTNNFFASAGIAFFFIFSHHLSWFVCAIFGLHDICYESEPREMLFKAFFDQAACADVTML